MKALSLWQPWATLVALEVKTYETRSWGTDYRGPLLICSTKTFNKECRELSQQAPFNVALHAGGYLTVDDLPLGAAVCLANLVEVTPTREMLFLDKLGKIERHFGDFSLGRFAWGLADVQVLPTPIPVKGKQGLWTPTSDVVRQVYVGLGWR